MKQYAVEGTYGSSKTPCPVYVCENSDGSKWYCVEGSMNVNKTFDELDEGVDVEYIEDFDCFTVSKPIYTLTQLETATDTNNTNTK